jgi:1,5-anhydro-D-fructose reductase (1,5-anhydro-D-mannitol-forming)
MGRAAYQSGGGLRHTSAAAKLVALERWSTESMTESRKVGWGIIGCGNVCEVKSGPAFQQAIGSELCAVMRRDRRLAEDFARRHGVPAAYDDPRALIADPRVNAVYIATPPGSHLELALQVAAAGKPAYVEKPMARCHAECLRMVDAFEAARVPLFVAYYRRALPRFRKAKELLESGRLGALSRIEVRYASAGQARLDRANLPWRVQVEHAGGGLFLDLACHSLDALDYLFGPLEDVSGQAYRASAPGDVEDRVTLRFLTQAKVEGSGAWDFSADRSADLIRVEGALGSLSFSTFGDEPLVLETEAGSERFELPNPRHIQQPLIQSIVDELLGRGKCPSSGLSAARTSQVMDRALLGYYGTRAPGFWAAPEHWPGRRP